MATSEQLATLFSGDRGRMRGSTLEIVLERDIDEEVESCLCGDPAFDDQRDAKGCGLQEPEERNAEDDGTVENTQRGDPVQEGDAGTNEDIVPKRVSDHVDGESVWAAQSLGELSPSLKTTSISANRCPFQLLHSPV